ncbi:MAG: hypothetical protein Q4F49_03190 [Pseudoxanthomonas suwonensis]|nr:hypothetical protein [Pseudoxanthomonas suwonensis]
MWLLAIPKALGMTPVTAALLLNAVAVGVLLWVMQAADRTGHRIPTLLTIAYLLLLTPFLGLATTMLAAGSWSAGKAWSDNEGGRINGGWLALSFVLIASGVCSKPQYALILWTLCLLAIPLLLQRQARPSRRLILVLALGSVLGFMADSGFRAVGKSEAIRTNSAVTLYAGLLVSGTGPGCGYWSVEASQAAVADMGMPLRQAVMTRLGEQPPAHWASVVGCKIPGIVRPSPFAVYWLSAAPNVEKARESEALEQRFRSAHRFERLLYPAISLLILALAAATTVRLRRRGHPAALYLLPMLWIAAFWSVHLVFEIQPRYFLGMYLLLPLWCLLAMRHAAVTPMTDATPVKPAEG